MMFTMQPWLLRRCGAAACDRNSGVFRLVPMRSSHSALADLADGVGKKLEALLMSTSRRPNRCSVSFTIAGSEAAFSRSACTSATESARTALSSACRARACSADER